MRARRASESAAARAAASTLRERQLLASAVERMAAVLRATHDAATLSSYRELPMVVSQASGQ
eukprot:1984254-Prymnesium_polylepis.1